MRNDICLLLTSTIKVQNKNFVKRNNTQVRLNDYKTALKKWLTKQDVIGKIVFVENSLWPLDELRAIVKDNNIFNKEVEFVSFKYTPKSDVDSSLGELYSMEHALKNSKLLNQNKYFVKVTGRLFVSNIKKIVKNLPDDFQMISLLSENLCYVDSAMVIFDRDFYINNVGQSAINLINNSKNKIDFEFAYAMALHAAIIKNYKWYPLLPYPIIDGISGKKNIAYNSIGKYSKINSILVTNISKLYHRCFRNSYGHNREHVLDRWKIKPEK